MKKNNLKKGIIILGASAILLTTGFSFASEENTFTRKDIINKANEQNFISSIESEIVDGNSTYVLTNTQKEDLTESKTQEYTSDVKTLNSNNEDYLNKNFDENYEFDDGTFKGTLHRVSYDIQAIDNGSYEKIDSKTITKTGITHYNDLNDIEKNIIIGNRSYVLISVDWQTDQKETVSGVEIPKTYKAVCLYQTKYQVKNPNTYRVSAKYSGTVVNKNTENKEMLISSYTKKEVPVEKKVNPIPAIIGIVGGLLALGLFILLPNAKIYALDDEGNLTKIKSFRIKNGKNVDISESKVKTSDYILEMSNNTYSRNSENYINVIRNGLSKRLNITKAKISFKM